ncbi:MAG TPA: hypothetical protein VE976_00145, partial [Actinomycetota bacterium]|nr:hypothetical protein [Actinomycetota bacterium]
MLAVSSLRDVVPFREPELLHPLLPEATDERQGSHQYGELPDQAIRIVSDHYRNLERLTLDLAIELNDGIEPIAEAK